jgi:DNA polymerase-3 subunit beta
VAILSAERSRAVRLQVGGGKLAMSSSNPELGEAQEELDIDYSGPVLNLGFNAGYLQEALVATRAKEVEIAFQDEMSPIQLRPTDDDDTLAIVMPMRL